MKKSIAGIALAFCAFALAFTGCSKKSSSTSTKLTKDNIKVGFIYIGSINDEGYTQAHDKGRLALEAEGIKCAYVENVPENADSEKAMRDLIDQGCNVIYATSFGFMDYTVKVATEFPKVIFGHCSGYKRADNMSTYFGKVFEARYLAGIVAGMKTKTNKIGYVAAFPLPECIRAINAFTLGVQSVNPDATVDVVWTNTWYAPDVEKQAALEVLNRGCDVIEQHQDSTAAQLAAQEKGAFALGYNTSTPTAAPKAYLTAPLFHWEVFYLDDVHSILNGTWKSRAFWEGLSSGMTSLDTLTSLCAPGTQEAVDAKKAQIIDGTFKIFAGPVYDQDGNVKVAEGTTMSDDDIWNMGWFVKGVKGTIPTK